MSKDDPRTIRRIEVTFPVGVQLSDPLFNRLVEVIDEVCTAYEAANPGRVMWTFGVGSKITYMPITKEEEDAGRGMEFDNDTISIEVAERERYHRWFTPKGINYDCCRNCGFIKTERNEDGPCRGKVTVGPRATPSSNTSGA